MLKKVALAVAIFALLTPAVFAQDGRFNASVGTTYSFNQQSSGNGITLEPTQAFGFLAALRIRLAAKQALEVNWGRTKDFQAYTAVLHYRIQTTITEFSGAYVFSPFRRGKIEPFLLAGAGVLIFNPNSSTVEGVSIGVGETRQKRAGFLYGGGVDYRVRPNIAVRLQYRGLLFESPDFGVQTLFTGQRGHMAEPSVGVVFHF